MSLFRRSDNMSCRQVGRVLQSYLDGELAYERRGGVLAHLEDCERCGLEADTIERMKTALRRRTPEVPLEVLDSLRSFSENLLLEGPGGTSPER